MTLDEMDAVIGLGKPASKTADWIVDTYLPNSPVSYRLSIEHAIATAIVEANRSPVGAVPVSALREIYDWCRDQVTELANSHHSDMRIGNAYDEVANRLSAVIRGTKT